jgi:2-dehydro-3-deoxyphosphogluconate aldolase / (4S)-4-hydroxy-2-oxoglutarate aldolase
LNKVQKLTVQELTQHNNQTNITMSTSRKLGYNKIAHAGIIPVFSSREHEVNALALEAASEAGYTVFEMTFRNSAAPELFVKLRKFKDENKLSIFLGAGTVYDLDEAKKMIDAGAEFIVSPVFSREVAMHCRLNDIPYCPGCCTPTELETASQTTALPNEEAVLKVFPADCAGGPNFIRSVLATRKGRTPWRLMPTGGVSIDETTLRNWFSAGVVSVGVGSNLWDRSAMETRQKATIVEDLRRTRELVMRVRNPYQPTV